MLIVDDHRAFAEALGLAIDLQDDLEYAGTAPTVRDSLRMLPEARPDVVLMDLHLPVVDGIRGTQKMKECRPEAQVLVLTADDDPAMMARAALAGATGFLAKTSPIAEILTAVRTASEGGILLDRSTLGAVLERLSDDAVPAERAPRGARLTPREREVLGLMGEGLDPKAIGKRLAISLNTTRGHVRNILQKLGVHSQLEAVVKAHREGLLRTL